MVHYPGEALQQPIYASPGYIVFQRGTEIWGVSFSLSDLAVDGTPFRIAHDAGAPSISADGTLVYLQGSGRRLQASRTQLVWVDRGGRISSAVGPPQRDIHAPVSSPDGQRVAAVTMATDRDTPDIWVQEESRGTKTRLTNDANHRVGTSVVARRSSDRFSTRKQHCRRRRGRASGSTRVFGPRPQSQLVS